MKEIIALAMLVVLSSFPFRVAAAEQTIAQGINQRQETDYSDISQTLQELSRIKVKAWDSDIPPAVKPLFKKLKRNLLGLISETANDETFHWKSTEELRSRVLSKMEKAGIVLPKENEELNDKEDRNEYSYNQVPRITIESPRHHKELLAVTTTLWVMCGEDTSFYLFRKEEHKWSLLIAQEATDYDTITGAHAWFGYSISPLAGNGSFFVVTANVNPWCSSNWQRIRYTVLRPSKDAFSPRILLATSAIIYLGIDPPVYKITTRTDRFRMEFRGDWYWDSDQGASHQYVIYRVQEDNVRLVKKGRLNN